AGTGAVAAVPTAGPFTLTTLVGRGVGGTAVEGPAAASFLRLPVAVATDVAGNVYVADRDNARIERVDAGTGLLTFVAGTGTPGAPTPGGPATASGLNIPLGVSVGPRGDVYIADDGNRRVEKVDAATGLLSVVAGTGATADPVPGTATDSPLRSPFGVAADAAGNVYVADRGAHRVLKVDAAGRLSVVAGTGVAGAVTPGPAVASPLNTPNGLAVDAAGNVFVALRFNHQVARVDAGTGVLSVVAGTGTAGVSTDVPATTARLNQPTGVAVDARGNVFVADRSNNRIVVVDHSSGHLSTVAGNGAQGAVTPGPATSSRLAIPLGIAVAGTGTAFVADQNNHQVQKLSLPPTTTPPLLTSA
ncbi:hypothetical protein GTR02_21785, partial [Kineococcus sp. R8]|nr:hypothetical protein [Kineococcus siccus]